MQEKKSYEKMVDQYYSIVFGYIMKKIGIREDAEDLTQDIFLNCHKDWENYDPDRGSVSTWLFAITDNRLKNYYRDKKLNLSLYEVDQEVLAGEDNLIECVINQEVTTEIFEKVMDCLNERQRQAIHYRFFEQMKMEEISRKINCSEGNTRVIIHRSIRKMNKYAQEHGIEWCLDL
ncbi:MAG: sigma-70 family RNA polymerase sigma factor [Eubacteriales bacterium]|nr:sigma-70 family RNA polymerase sigma factor [Eubacteriales bacterium]